MCLRDNPPMFGPSLMGLKTLVATTHSSSLAYSLSARPVTSSLAPREYISAVWQKVIPFSTAKRKKGREGGSSSTQGRQLGRAKPTQPKQRLQTRTAVLPRKVDLS